MLGQAISGKTMGEKNGEGSREQLSGVTLVKKVSMFARVREVRKASLCEQPIYLAYLREKIECDRASSPTNQFPSSFKLILQEYEDVFSENIPRGLPPLSG